MRRLASVLALVATLSAAPARAVRQSQGEVRLSADEVLLDLVVTDKKGHAVTDLKPQEVEVYENGAKQDVTSFGLVRGGPDAAGGAGDGAAGADASAPAAIAESDFNGVNLVLIVVDRTSVDVASLTQVYKATEAFVNQRLAVNDLVAVFVSTNRPILLQNFTNNKTRLLAALKNATAGTTVVLQEATGDAARADLERARENETADPNARAADERADQRRNRELEADALGIDTYFVDLRDQMQTLNVINSVIALTKAYAEIPGRKSMVLYSQGFALAEETKAPFDAMVAAANRANFTINAVNAGGLEANARRGASDDRGASQAYLESNDRMLVHDGESGMGRYIKQSLNLNDEALSRLAKETGGVLVRNTNDLGRGFDQIASDLRSYYALSYQPTKAELDGSFRTLDVRVSRKDVVVRSRKGYYAVPGGGNSVLLPFESPVLAMLSSSAAPRPADVKVAFKTERFAGDGAWRVPVALAVGGAALSAAPRDPKAKTPDDGTSMFETDAVVLVRDASGAVVGKLSRASFFRAPKDRISEFKDQMLPLTQFPETLDLAPGAYTLQVGVYDPNGKKGSVVERRISLPALPAAGQPALSSLVLSRGAATVGAGGAAPSDPLVMGGKTRIVPNATGQFQKSKGDKLVAYFTLRAAPNTSYEMLIQFMQDDKLVVGTPPQALPPTDANGMVAYSPVLPLDKFEPGSYRAILYIVPAGSNQPIATSMTPFTVAP